MTEVTLAMVALGGYANFYLERLFAKMQDHDVKLIAGIDPNPVGCQYLDEFKARDIPIYSDLDTFYSHDTADLVVIAAPIHLHRPFTVNALAHGSNVLVEKPVAATIQDALAMREAERNAPGFVAVGYQWSYAKAMLALKADIMAGVLGKARRLRTMVFWPRGESYYQRNNWAARIRNDRGDWILDSPVNNAMAHYLHNCFFVLGDKRETSARPASLQAELYRAKDIENYDTAALRVMTVDGVEILFYVSHSVPVNYSPMFSYEFDNATVTFGDEQETIIATFKDGSTRDYGDPFAGQDIKIWECADAVRDGNLPACGIMTAASHTLCVNGAQDSAEIVTIPESVIRQTDDLSWVEGLEDLLRQSCEAGKLPAEIGGYDWLQAGKLINLQEYGHYPGGK